MKKERKVVKIVKIIGLLIQKLFTTKVGKIVDATLTGGVINNINDNVDKYPQGKVDPYRLIGGIIATAICYMVFLLILKDKLSIEDVKYLLDVLK